MDQYQPLPDDADHAQRANSDKSDVFTSTWELLKHDFKWGSDESHFMLVRYCFFWMDRPVEEVLQHPVVRFNPLYWLLWFLAIICLVSGRWTHSVFGQGDGFPGESELEREVRIYWLYCTDGPVLMATLVDFYELGVAIEDNALGWNNDTLILFISFCVNFGFLAGNITFAHAMRQRRATAVKMILGCNFAFASGLAVALVYGAVKGYSAWDSDNEEIVSYTLRVIVVLFVLLACYIYAPLWNHYDGHPEAGEEADSHAAKMLDCRVVAPVVCVTLVVWLMLLIVFTIDGGQGYSDVWAALT